MARKEESHGKASSLLHGIGAAVKRIFTRGHREVEEQHDLSAAPQHPRRAEASTSKARPTRREADIPLDVLDRAYTPPLTSSKASFRSDGRDHQSDQEFAFGTSDERWADEDRFTNKSGDPRIGTHRRTYEAGEIEGETAESRD